VVLTSTLGNEVVKEEDSVGISLFIAEGERGGGPGPTGRRQDVGGLPDRLDHDAVSGPLS
jgi:hypothetical protein